jgi:hypothetical protein
MAGPSEDLRLPGNRDTVNDEKVGAPIPYLSSKQEHFHNRHQGVVPKRKWRGET